ncbi:hypothetical protein FIBSPDRAFT_848936 [Athelia psychrophila]|uniref:Secreted protein n=1 Tax=Athelia psychrophila TaxID=1759441 RepID=A0A166URQ8_9AGAM|nr:hypothetical protein FIBSPDRAFT_848936 [Fibularhizoctonia sp. CBS 109695]
MSIGARCALLHLLAHTTYTHASHINIAASASAWAPSQQMPPTFSSPKPGLPRVAHVRVQLALVFQEHPSRSLARSRSTKFGLGGSPRFFMDCRVCCRLVPGTS